MQFTSAIPKLKTRQIFTAQYFSLAILVLSLAPHAGAQPPAILIESCNLFPDSDRRLQCLKVAMGVDSHSTKQHPFVEKAKASITKDLKDPSSTQFRNIFLSRRGEQLVLCGELNAKNSYGAYVGFKRFYSMAEDSYQEIESSDTRVFDALWPDRCGNRVNDVE